MYEDAYLDSYWEDRFEAPLYEWPPYQGSIIEADHYGPEDDDYGWDEDYEDEDERLRALFYGE